MYNGLVNGVDELDALVDAVEDVVESDMAFVCDQSRNRSSSQRHCQECSETASRLPFNEVAGSFTPHFTDAVRPLPLVRIC